ncbi:fimbrial protein [Providencia sneebia]|uniref:Type III fimbriae structural protein MrkF n=1 Tax=Providencia sneebia DSM 19967 TaxID=1141660 RepID=K8WLC2_9GAMM|nr:fimbrial protein [Providencia sneebia]EKT58282.1 type III fimbriae structural protein MrkF [Providencia sneebia DSM 19967]
MKNWIIVIFFSLVGYAYAAPAFKTNYDEGKINFSGKVVDVSCAISVNDQGSDASIYLAPISLFEIHNSEGGAYLKSQMFTIKLSQCQSITYKGNRVDGNLNNISVGWSDGYLVTKTNFETTGLLKNMLADGAKNINFALAINDKSILDANNKIIPAGPNQLKVIPITSDNNDVIFQYYIGYVAQKTSEVTTGLMASYATYEINYN